MSSFLKPAIKDDIAVDNAARLREPSKEPEKPIEISPITGRPKVQRNRPAKYNKKKIVTGMIFGNLIIRRKLAPKKDVKPSLRERWRCECTAKNWEGKICGRIIEVPKYYLVRKPNPKTDCGCTTQTMKSKYNREYRIWNMMNVRTSDPRHIAYKHYASNGITVCDEWRKDAEDGLGFERWFEHIGPAPSQYHSLDRVRNAEGYYPGNVRWATSSEQRINQGDLIAGKSKKEILEMGLTVDEFVQKVIDGEI